MPKTLRRDHTHVYTINVKHRIKARSGRINRGHFAVGNG